jgi:hypothetical protein
MTLRYSIVSICSLILSRQISVFPLAIESQVARIIPVTELFAK